VTKTPGRLDLIVVAADLGIETVVRALLQRTQSMQIRQVAFEIQRLVGDSKCCRTAHEYLRSFVRQFDYALVVFDRAGSGRESLSRAEIEAKVEGRLSINGWKDRSAAVVLDPELEIWVWSDSGEVPAVLGWSGRQPELRTWLRQNFELRPESGKPVDPKAAFERALELAGSGPPARIFRQLAERVSPTRCADGAFLKFRSTLQNWFPLTGHGL
jgi:hypothetical protein